MMGAKRITAALLLAASAGAGAADNDAAMLEKGKRLFTQTAAPPCMTCHTLRHAEAAGEIGPNLNEMAPDAARVEKAVRNGIGVMPAFKLSEADLKLLAQYVAAASRLP
ncbi:cytochrome c [Pseudoduganella ginsengisoli]|uniref:C-type cytochrome n=1 Tax=Pseudoduganella ginsengisoli TaxID=1462440 RepID=A0A6L6Q3B6_9BURK|nr:cytochrome c [Pseudoduganella ginsengisoli]MTW03708.1 c-type cytochrome [Pseudoduganella ginsengisoli]